MEVDKVVIVEDPMVAVRFYFYNYSIIFLIKKKFAYKILYFFLDDKDLVDIPNDELFTNGRRKILNSNSNLNNMNIIENVSNEILKKEEEKKKNLEDLENEIYMINNKKTFENFVRSEVNQDKLIDEMLNTNVTSNRDM